MNPRPSYSTDVTDTEWELVRPYVPEAKPGGRLAAYPKREIMNGIFFLLRSGCVWSLLTHDLPPWRIVYYYFWQFLMHATSQVIHHLLRDDAPWAAGKQQQPWR